MPQNAAVPVVGDIKDLSLADPGKRRIEWAFQSMPVLQSIRKQLIKSQALADRRILACLHITPETANLIVTLRDGGANLVLCAANPVTTQDDVAASLVRDYNVPVLAVFGETPEMRSAHFVSALEHSPEILIEEGAELVRLLHTRHHDVLSGVLAGTEATATGVRRLNAMAREGVLAYPVIAVNDAETNHLFDNRYGTGQSTIDAIIRSTNILLAGMTVVVAGYGWCGRGVAVRARGLGANVIVTESDAARALEAVMDGCRVMTMAEAAPLGDLFVTATGNKNVISRDHFSRIKGGAILCNAGHSNVEIDVATLGRMVSSRKVTREFVEEFKMRDGRSIHVLAGGGPVNLIAGDGHPASVMDIKFANQALSIEYLIKNHQQLEKTCHVVPPEIDAQVARMKLESLGINIDRLTPEQETYLNTWAE